MNGRGRGRETMPAFRITEWERAPAMVEATVPRPAAGEVVVRVAGNGLCHSDLVMAQIPAAVGEAIGWQVPFTLGHEIAGWVALAGRGVTGWSEGDAVAVVSPSSCGTCEYCRAGQEIACDHGTVGRGYGRDGGLAPYVLIDDTRALLPLERLDPKVAGPLTDAGATSCHAVKRVLPKLAGAGAVAVVIGAGGLGAYAIQLLRAMSDARVIAVDVNPARLGIARELGAHATLAGVDGSTTAELLARTGGHGAHAVLDFVGTDDTIDTSLGAVRKLGAYALVGAGGGRLNRPWFGATKEADVICFQGSNIADARDVLALAEQGLIRSEIDQYPLDRVTDAYHALDAGTLRGRAVVVPGG
ncbi:MAG: alcohol dehydrogenase catalytic domain-containing protein [Acidimicrobiia bacterium]